MSRRLAIEYLEQLDEMLGARNDGYTISDANDVIQASYYLMEIDSPLEGDDKKLWAIRQAAVQGWTYLSDAMYFEGETRAGADLRVCFRRRCDQ